MIKNEDDFPIALDIDARGLRLTLWKYPPRNLGVAKKRNILFLHGYFDTGRSFDALIHHLAPDTQAFALDFRGHGQSDWAPKGASYHILDHAKDVYCVLHTMRNLGTPIDVLVGHSMGGVVALFVAASAPSLVPSLVLLDSLGAPAEEANNAPMRLAQALEAHLKPTRPLYCASVEEAIEKLLQNTPQLTRAGAALMAKHMIVRDKEDPSKTIFAFDPRMKGPTPFRFGEDFWLAFCSNVEGKTLIVRAEHGYLGDSPIIDQRVKAFKNARLIDVPAVSHHFHVDAPAQIAEVLNSLV